MIDISGNDLARILAQKYPSVKILVLTSMDILFYITDMMRAGCKGYLPKSAGGDILLEAIEEVYKGNEYLMPSVKERLLQNLLHDTSSRKAPTLTRREKEILRLIAKGYTSSAIAAQLFLSQRTVENHGLSILQKLGAKNTVTLLNIASDMGLL